MKRKKKKFKKKKVDLPQKLEKQKEKLQENFEDDPLIARLRELEKEEEDALSPKNIALEDSIPEEYQNQEEIKEITEFVPNEFIEQFDNDEKLKEIDNGEENKLIFSNPSEIYEFMNRTNNKNVNTEVPIPSSSKNNNKESTFASTSMNATIQTTEESTPIQPLAFTGKIKERNTESFANQQVQGTTSSITEEQPKKSFAL